MCVKFIQHTNHIDLKLHHQSLGQARMRVDESWQSHIVTGEFHTPY